MGRVRDTAERLWQGEGETQMSPLAIFAGLEQLTEGRSGSRARTDTIPNRLIEGRQLQSMKQFGLLFPMPTTLRTVLLSNPPSPIGCGA